MVQIHTGYNFKIRRYLAAGQTYYVKVSDYSDNTGYFNIYIKIDTVLVESVAIDTTSVILNIGDSVELTATVLPSNAANKSITWESSNPEIISVDYAGKVTANAVGSAVITATAQDGSLVCGACTIDCDTYLYSLVNMFGLTKEVALLIRKLYNKVDDIFADETEMQKAWKCSRLLGGIVYGNDTSGEKDQFKWVDVAGNIHSTSEEYLINVLGYSEYEYSQMESAIKSQHADSTTPDFAHLQISLAARLAYKLDLDGMVSNIGTISSDENVSYLAGWLGDATITNSNGATSFRNDDYCADLDAENVYRLMLANMSSIDAFNEYYSQIFSGANRANIFLGYISYDYVQEKVFFELIDKALINSMVLAYQVKEYSMALYYSKLMSDEEYHWKRIKEECPDTYDFLKSLKDCEADIAHYE